MKFYLRNFINGVTHNYFGTNNGIKMTEKMTYR